MFGACAGGDASRGQTPRACQGIDTALASPARTSDTAPTGAFRAVGTEPFWSLDINGTGLGFTTPGDKMEINFPPISSMVTGDTLRWVGETERAPIDARVWPAHCSDGMSNRIWPYTAVVRIDGTTYRGCAERGARPQLPDGSEGS